MVYLRGLVILALLSSCEPAPNQVRPAFFHWKTALLLQEDEQEYLQQLQVKRLYVRFFDVDWDPEMQDAVPLATAYLNPQGLEGIDVIPTLFITNRTLELLPAKQIPVLASRILKKIEAQHQQLPHTTFPELQIDCDWTQSTRKAYFQLLSILQDSVHAQGRQLSATLRLHQFTHFRQTGVPPADRAMLMCYNTGVLENWEEKNSIYQEKAVKPYLTAPPTYPLPLDLALPAFQWGVVFRNGQLVRLIHNLEAASLLHQPAFRQISTTRFRVEKSTYLEGYYLYQGDQIRLERTGSAEIESALRLIKPIFKPGSAFTVSVYHLDSTLIQRIPHATMARLFDKAR